MIFKCRRAKYNKINHAQCMPTVVFSLFRKTKVKTKLSPYFFYSFLSKIFGLATLPPSVRIEATDFRPSKSNSYTRNFAFWKLNVSNSFRGWNNTQARFQRTPAVAQCWFSVCLFRTNTHTTAVKVTSWGRTVFFYKSNKYTMRIRRRFSILRYFRRFRWCAS